ncbi:MAG: AI-2E family transporter [Anaerolineales bacterium]|nr:AI-2E family transporter [Anaerolineales bacterium]
MRNRLSPSTKNVLLLLAGLALLALAIWLLIFLRPLLVALTIAALLAFLLNPFVVGFANRFGLKRALAAALTFILVIAIFGGLFVLLGTAVWDQWPRLQQELGEAIAVMQGWLTRPLLLFGFVLHPETVLENFALSWRNALSAFTIGSDGLLTSLTDNLLWTLVVIVSFYYLLKDGHRIQPYLLNKVPQPYKADVSQLFAEIDMVWGVFLRVQLFIFVVLALLIVSSSSLIIWLFRQGWLPLSPIGLGLLLLGVYAAIQQVDNLWLRPQLMGRAFKLHPGITFVGLIAGLALSGLLGALLIVPILVTTKVLARFIYFHLPLLFEYDLDVEPDPTQKSSQEEPDTNFGEDR